MVQTADGGQPGLQMFFVMKGASSLHGCSSRRGVVLAAAQRSTAKPGARSHRLGPSETSGRPEERPGQRPRPTPRTLSVQGQPRLAPCPCSSDRVGHHEAQHGPGSSPVDSLRRQLAAQVRQQRADLWAGDLHGRRHWLDVLERESSGGWQETYGGLFTVLESVARHGVSFSLSEATGTVGAAKQRNGPDSLEMGKALGAAGLALLVGLNPSWRQAERLLSEAIRIHSAWLGPGHCGVFLLTTFREASMAVATTRNFNLETASARTAAAARASGHDSAEAAAALAEGGIALVLVGHIQQGRSLLREAAEVTAVCFGAGDPITSICLALSEEDLLWVKHI